MNRFQSIIVISILIVLAETSSTRRSNKPPTKPAHLTTVTTPARKTNTKFPTARTTEPTLIPSTLYSTESQSSEDTSMATPSFSKGTHRSKNPKHPKRGPIDDPPIVYDYEEYENTQEKDEKNSDDTKFDEEDENGVKRWIRFELVFVVLLVLELM